MEIFVSYARQDADTVREIREALGRLGHEVWMDRELKGGQQWWDVILGRIRACDIFMFALSPDSAKSKACPSEIAYAAATHRPILPVMVRTTDVRVFPRAVSDVQFVDYTMRDANSVVDLISALSRLPADTPLPDPLPPVPPAPGVDWEAKRKQVSAEGLSFKEQAGLFTEIRASAGSEEDAPVVIDLLRQFRHRADIVESVGHDIDRLLVELGEVSAQTVTPLGTSDPESRGGDDTGALGATSQRTARADGEPAVPSADGQAATTHRFAAPSLDLRNLTKRLENWFSSERMESQAIESDGAVLIQGRSEGRWGRALGAGVAFSIKLWMEDDDLVVEIGQMKWADKGAAAAVGLLVFWPALIPAVVGGAKQAALAKKALRVVEGAVREFA